jgi:hypothetical protein
MRMAQLRGWAQAIKKDVVALYIAGRDPRVPWYAKLAAVVVEGDCIASAVAHRGSSLPRKPQAVPGLGLASCSSVEARR